MSVRECDPSFNADEKLWRGIEKSSVNAQGNVKPNALRLQVSVVREKHGEQRTVTHDKWNGIAEAKVTTVSGLRREALSFVCVDDAQRDEPGHALIAMVAQPGAAVGQDAINGLRAELALSLQVVLVPTRT